MLPLKDLPIRKKSGVIRKFPKVIIFCQIRWFPGFGLLAFYTNILHCVLTLYFHSLRTKGREGEVKFELEV